MRRASGTPSLAAIIVEHAVKDFLFAPQDSAAYRTAKKFIYGGECTHVVCTTCLDGRQEWRTGECPPGKYAVPCGCGHDWGKHLIMTFDWEEHRDLITGAAGIEPEALCTAVHTVENPSRPKATENTSKRVSRKS